MLRCCCCHVTHISAFHDSDLCGTACQGGGEVWRTPFGQQEVQNKKKNREIRDWSAAGCVQRRGMTL